MAVRRSSVFELGIPVIGSPHQRSIEHINAVAHAQQEHNNDDIPSALDGRREYSLSQFAFKQSLMENARHPLTHGHKKMGSYLLAG
ncbi:hypothetical protein [Teredinibacter franksiae]|uniref:hypothetical protein n=1 Tax=Teredinibacter franksiae TaxID=2761453 RepID=UPI0016286B1E|nr:hypothetical protein [Teredinibacter franksiae]